MKRRPRSSQTTAPARAAALWLAAGLLAGSATAHAQAIVAHGVVAHLPSAGVMLVDVKEAEHTAWVNRQLSVRVRGITPSSRSGSAQRDRLQLDGLLLGQTVELSDCARAGNGLLCHIQVRLNQQRDLRHNVADLLVANGLARRQ